MDENKIVIYQTEDGQTQIDVRLENDTVWLTQAQMAELFERTPQNITMHIRNAYNEGELEKESTCKEYLQVQTEGKRCHGKSGGKPNKPTKLGELRMVEWKKLGEICYISDYVSNGSFASLRENVQYKSEPDYAILVRFADYSNGFDTSKFVYIDEHAYHFLSKSYLEGGEIIMSNVGSCGLLFRCPKLDRKMSLAPNSILIKSEFIDYLYYWLGGNVGQEEIRKITSKSAMPKFNKTEFKKIQVPIPSLEEQARIVSILDTFTASIDNLKEQIAQRRKQFEHYRDQLLDLEGKEGFERIILKDVCEVINGRAYSQPELLRDGKYRVLRVGNFFSNDSWYYSDLELDDKYYCENGDLLYAWSASFGPHIWEEEKVIYHYHIWKMNCGERVNKKFMFYWLQSEDMRSQAFTNLHGATMAHLTKALMESLMVPIPSKDEQSRIVSILDTFEASIANLEAQLSQREKQYEYYRNKLLTFE